MSLKSHFSVSKNVVTSLKESAFKDQDLKKNLTTAGGLVSLIGIAPDLYDNYQDERKNPTEKAFASPLKFLFKTTLNVLKDLDIANREN
jgi:hypothetical protein